MKAKETAKDLKEEDNQDKDIEMVVVGRPNKATMEFMVPDSPGPSQNSIGFIEQSPTKRQFLTEKE